MLEWLGVLFFGFCLGWISAEVYESWERRSDEKNRVWTPTNKRR